MKAKIIALSATVALFVGGPSQASDVLTGDTRLACEATLCLLAPSAPSECNDSLKKYFSIKAKKAKDTAKARASFLALCPKK